MNEKATVTDVAMNQSPEEIAKHERAMQQMCDIVEKEYGKNYVLGVLIHVGGHMQFMCNTEPTSQVLMLEMAKRQVIKQFSLTKRPKN